MIKEEHHMSGYGEKILDSYIYLIRNWSDEDKIELIARISNSIIKRRKKVKKEKTKEEILAETYGSFISEKTADEIIADIHSSRHFREKPLSL
jgi:hypothetical protein